MGAYYIGAAKTLNPNDTSLNKQYQIYIWLNKILASAGYPNVLRGLVIAQVMHETGNFTSRLATDGTNNISGIKYTKNSPYQSGKSGMYATYKTYEDWAKDLKRILNFKPSKPFEANNIVDYARRLKANGYYENNPKTGSEGAIKIYIDGLTRWVLANNKAINWAKGIGKKMATNSSTSQQIVNTEGWTAADDNAVAKQEQPKETVTQWIKANPLPAAFIGLASLMLVKQVLK